MTVYDLIENMCTDQTTISIYFGLKEEGRTPLGVRGRWFEDQILNLCDREVIECTWLKRSNYLIINIDPLG